MSSIKPVKLARRLGIISYDLIIIAAILLLSTTFLFFVLFLLNIDSPEPYSIYFRLYLLGVIVSYYHVCWAYLEHGQTIGMKAWRVKLENNTASSNQISNKITLQQSILRILGGIITLVSLGTSNIILYLNKKHITLAEYLSKTRLILI